MSARRIVSGRRPCAAPAGVRAHHRCTRHRTPLCRAAGALTYATPEAEEDDVDFCAPAYVTPEDDGSGTTKLTVKVRPRHSAYERSAM